MSALSKPKWSASPKKNQKPTPPPSKLRVTATTPGPTPPHNRRPQSTTPTSASVAIAQEGQIRAAARSKPPAINNALAKSGAKGYLKDVPEKSGFWGGRFCP